MAAPPDIDDLRARLEELDAGDPDAVERLDVMAELAWAARFRDWQVSRDLADEALQRADAIGAKAVSAKAGRALLLLRRWAYDLQGALDAGLHALAAFQDLGDREGEAATSDGLATIFEELGQFGTALEYARAAYDIGVETGDEARQGWALSSLGGIHCASGEHEEGLRLLDQASELFGRLANPAGVGRVSFRKGKFLIEHGKLDAARACYEKLFAEQAKTGGKVRHFARYSGLGELAMAEGDYQEARRLFEAALEGLGKEGRSAMALDVERSLADLCVRDGSLGEARQRMETLLADPRLSKTKPARAKLHGQLAEVCEQDGDLAAALHHLKRFNVLRAEVDDDESRLALHHERTRREIDSARKDAEIHRLRFVELAAMQSRLVEREKLAALGNLAAGVAHELNTPLAALRSNLELLRKTLGKLDGEPDARKLARVQRAASSLVDTSEAAGTRMARFAKRVTQFAGVDQATLRDTDLRDCVASVLTIIEPGLPAGVTVRSELDEADAILANAARINQALMTVVLHAAEGAEKSGGGEVHVRLAAGPSEIVVTVEDRGHGVDPEAAARLFDMAFESHDATVQLNMGLPTVAATMAELGGRAEAESQLGEGTTIRLRFPRSASG